MHGTVSIAPVRDVLESKWLYFQMLQLGIANFTALAIKIKPDVEKRSGTPVSTNTVVAALNRVYRNLEGNDDLLHF